MKLTFNLSICRGESDFLADENERLRQMQGYDGLEVQMIDDPPEGLIDPHLVIGLHMTCIPCWYALWAGNEKALIDEFGDLATAEAYYGGLSRETLLDKFRRDLFYAKKFGAEYLVFHIAECNVLETYTENYIHTDEQICEACAEMLNLLFADQEDGPLLLLENLWHPGMNLRRPEITRDMLAAVRYPKKGIMLDTGHLMNANTRKLDSTDKVEPKIPVLPEMMTATHRKVRFPKEGTALKQISHKVNQLDLDFNGHVNNRSYVSIAMLTVPDEFLTAHRTNRFVIHWLRESYLGENLTCTLRQIDVNSYVHLIDKENGETAAEIFSAWEPLTSMVDVAAVARRR